MSLSETASPRATDPNSITLATSGWAAPMAAAAAMASSTVGGQEAKATAAAMVTSYVGSLSPAQPAATRMISAGTRALSELVEKRGVDRYVFNHLNSHTQPVLLQQLAEIIAIH